MTLGPKILPPPPPPGPEWVRHPDKPWLEVNARGQLRTAIPKPPPQPILVNSSPWPSP